MATSPAWDAETLWQQLVPVWPGISVEVVPELASTNTTLLQRSADPAPCLLVAEHQTQGRGRMGRAWHSEAGASLTFSLALPLAPLRWEGLSLAVGLALAQALEATAPGAAPRLLLKWPNDLWLGEPGDGRKLGGVLVETATRSGVRWAVVGVGLNIRPHGSSTGNSTGSNNGGSATAQAPAEAGLAHGYASLQELHPGIQAPQALARVALPLALALRRFETEGFAPLAPAFAARDLLRGHAVHTNTQPPLQGLAQGVDLEGALLVQAGGALHRVHSGEVSVRLQGSAAPPQPLTESA